MKILIIITMLSLSYSATLYVPTEYSTIQSAIDASSDGDEVYAYPGTYYENINFNGKNISLIGEDRETTIIDGGHNGRVVEIDNIDELYLSGFTIQNGEIDEGNGAGILIMNSENSSVTVNLSLAPSYSPLPPVNIWALTAPDYIDLWWEPSPGPGDTLSYIILRDGDFLNYTSDTLYTDESVANNTAYEYSIAALSNIGISELISISTNTAEPDYPAEPEEFLFLPDWDKINLWWNISSGPGTSLSYIIYRNGDSLTTVEDTSYMDINVSSSQTYQYEFNSN